MKITADINNADGDWVQVTLSGPDVSSLTAADIEAVFASVLDIDLHGTPTGPVFVNHEPYYSRADVQKWRNDAFENAAGIASQYGADEAAIDILALVRR